MMKQNQKMGYAEQSGVDVRAADDWVERLQLSAQRFTLTEQKNKIVSSIGDYAAVYKASESQWIVTACDGVGTKLLWTIQGLGSVEDLAQDLLAMNANDVLCVGARPQLFLDYLAVGSKKLLENGGPLEGLVCALQKHCFQSGQLLVGGETAQMPDLYEEGHFDLAGFSVGFMAPEDYLSVARISEGDELWAWPSSGPHANGYSWLRKLFDEEKDEALIRSLFMRPTELYVNPFFEFRKAIKESGFSGSPLKAAFHMTGSGWLNLIRSQPEKGSIGMELSNWDPRKDPPDWLKAIVERSGAEWEELLSSFNCGYGFVLTLNPDFCRRHEIILKKFALRRLGKVLSGNTVKFPGICELK